MTRVTVDSATQAKLQACGTAVLCSETGKVLGFFQSTSLPEGVKSPISDEELEQLRKQRNGSPLEEVLKRLSEQ